MAARKDRKGEIAGRPILEWAMAALGALLTLTALGFILMDLRTAARPPELSVRLVETRATSTATYAEIEVRNAGGQTAAQVHVEGQAGPHGAAAVLDYVPGRGRERATLVFPTQAPPPSRLHVVGWSEP
ncbi:hypothetical protein Q0812_01085 [Brevundimonas sp. 2R-24]|uniref:TIGR02588 family protein n=1 Tax=Peiella sedimenti TaxID=3061083 RepID=A0ABT8SJ02_9CAUL|nr:hypothetical protein [Caulobacteraceae bacterium XZ-24]